MAKRTINRVSTNGKPTQEGQEQFLQFLQRITQNQIYSREALNRELTGGVGHDIDKACGYPLTLTFEQYKFMIEREGIATRANSIYADECFSMPPYVYETESVDQDAQTPFEIGWTKQIKNKPVLSKLHRLDVVTGYGNYGVLVIGTNDGKNLDVPFAGIDENGDTKGDIKEHELLYLMPYSQGEMKIDKLETRNNKRYGKPITYNLHVADPTSPSLRVGKALPVHWTRCIHSAEGCTSSDILGPPRLEKVFNYILNIRKIMGGSAEMFYLGGFPGISFEVPPELVSTGELDKKGLTEQIEAYMSGFRRYLATSGLHANQLQPNIADPSAHIQGQLMALCIALEVPLRIFTGSEEARLASMNDSDAWNRRIHRRQDIHVTPNILRPTVDRFIQMGILPKPDKGEYNVKWPDVYAVSEKDRADIAGKLVRALAEYIKSGAFKMFPPAHFFTRFLDLTTDEAEKVIADAAKLVKSKEFDYLDDLVQKPKDPNMPNGSPTKGTVNPRRRAPLGATRKVRVSGLELTINSSVRCRRDGKPGFKCGDDGTCFTFIEGDVDSKKSAKKKAKIEGAKLALSKHLSGLEAASEESK